MATIKELKEDILELRGATVNVFGQPTTLFSECDSYTIDVINVLNALEDYEVRLDADYVRDTFIYVSSDNSYNWGSPISNDINFEVYRNGDTYIILKVHRFGDVRGNYTDEVVLRFDYDDSFQCVIFEDDNTRRFHTVTIDGIEYSFEIDIFSDSFEVYNEDGEYVCTAYGDCDEDVIEVIKEKIGK